MATRRTMRKKDESPRVRKTHDERLRVINMKTNEILRKVVDSSLAVEKAVLDEKTAFFSSDPAASRRVAEREDHGYFRTPFARDADRIMHCHSYARYMDKTQVFFQIKNDHISRRSLHVQMVSRIAPSDAACG